MVEQGIWRVNTDRELRELYKDLDIVADIGMGWTYVQMDQGRTVRIYESKLRGSRRSERLILRDGWKMERRICRR